MKLTIDERMLDALQLMNYVVCSYTPKPILKCVKLEANEDGLSVSATDLEIHLRCSIDCNVAEPGRICVPFTHLKSALAGLLPGTKPARMEFFKEPEVTLETTETAEFGCTIQKGDTKIHLFGYDAKNYPMFPVLPEDFDFGFQVKADTLSSMIPQVMFAATKSYNHYAISGVLWEVEKDRIKMVATDGGHLMVVKGKINSPVPDKRNMIVDMKTTCLLPRALSGKSSVDVGAKGDDIFIRQGNVSIVSRLVQGNFPNYGDVIPKDIKCEATVETERFEQCLRQVHNVTDEESRGVQMVFHGDSITMSGRAPGTGDAQAVCPAENANADMEIIFNPSSLLLFLRATNADRIAIGLSNPNRPVLIRNAANREAFDYVVMPVR